MRLRFFMMLTILGAALAGVLSAQNNVNLTVVVTGSNGAPMLDLNKNNFSLLDSGKPRTIDSFRALTAASAVPAMQANEFTNAPDAGESGAIFVVLDTVHTRYLDERDIRDSILKFLARAAQAKRTVCLAILSQSGLHVYHDYRTSSDVLLAALLKMGVRGLQGVTPPAGVNDADVSAEAERLTAFSKGDQSNPTPVGSLLRSSVDMPLTMFRDVSYAAYGLPGRKSLVWVTTVVPFDIDSKTFQFVSPKEANFGAAVNGAQTPGTKDALSGNEVKRIMPLWRESMRALFDAGVSVDPVEAKTSFTAGGGSFTQDRMKTLAQITAGKAFYGSNDPLAQMLQSTSDARGYTLGFAEEMNATTQFHRVQVSLDRADAAIIAPPGYFPLEGTAKSRAQDEVSFALRSPLVYSGLSFRLKFAGTEENAGKKKVNLVISLAGDSGVLNESTGTADLAVVALAKDAKDATAGKLSEIAGGKFPPEAVAQIKELGFQLRRSIEVPSSGQYTLHMVLYDNQTGRMGSLIVPMTVQ